MDESQNPPSAEAIQQNNADDPSGSRRNFLQLGALVVTGIAGACSSSTGEEGTGGTTPGTGGNGSGSGGSGSGGSASGGSGSGSGGTTASGGSSASGGSGSGTGGMTASGGKTGSGGGTASGGSSATGGANGGGGASSSSGGAGGGNTSSSGGAGGSGGGGTGMGWKENNYLPLPELPKMPGPSVPKLPDPFKFLSGGRISSKGDWEKLRADLSATIQAAVYGPKPPPPDELTATMSGSMITVNMKVGSKTGSFTFSASGGSMASPKAAVIRCGGSGVPFPSDVVSITLNTDTFAAQNKMIPTTGLVSTLYGSAAAKSGSDICWAWGASRIIDALEKLPAAGIDPKRIAVTGCSYAGKGALAMGAFDERVVLTVVQEGGSGGTALWRVSTAEAKAGQNIQEATEIVGEQNWEGGDFKALFSGKSKTSAPVDMLIADQHFAVAICAPRAILIIENDIDWLGPVATYGGGIAGKTVYEALGIKDRCGVSVAPNHGHCSFPSSQQADLTAYINRFVNKMSTATTSVDLLNATNSKLKMFNKADWIDWDTPMLSGSLPWDPFG